MSDIVCVVFVRDVRIPPKQELYNRVWSQFAETVPASGKVMSIITSNNGVHLSSDNMTRMYPWHMVEHVEYSDVKKNKS